MSSSNFTRPTKPNYFVNFLVKGYIFPAVLIAVVLATFLGVSFQVDLFSQLTEENAKTFFIAFVVFFLAVLTIYTCVSLKNYEVGMNDSVSFGYIFAGVFYFLYLVAYGEGLQYLDLTNIVIIIALIFVGIILTLFSSLYFHYDVEEDVNKKKCYLVETSKRFNFISILLTSIIINFIFFLLLNIKHCFVDALVEKGYSDAPNYFFTYFKDMIWDNKILLVFTAIGVLFLFLYSIFALNEKKVNVLDLFIWGYIFNIPMLIALVYLLGNNEDMMNYIVVGGLTVLIIIFAIIRNVYYKKQNLKENNFKFLGNFFNPKNIFLSFGLMAIVVTFIRIVNVSTILELFIEEDKFNLYLGLLPFALLFVTCLMGYLFVAFSLIKSAVIFKKPAYDRSDNILLYNIAFGLFELISAILIEETMNFVIIAIFASYVIVTIDIVCLRKSSTK